MDLIPKIKKVFSLKLFLLMNVILILELFRCQKLNIEKFFKILAQYNENN